jgi:hypothetical protein
MQGAELREYIAAGTPGDQVFSRLMGVLAKAPTASSMGSGLEAEGRQPAQISSDAGSLEAAQPVSSSPAVGTAAAPSTSTPAPGREPGENAHAILPASSMEDDLYELGTAPTLNPVESSDSPGPTTPSTEEEPAQSSHPALSTPLPQDPRSIAAREAAERRQAEQRTKGKGNQKRDSGSDTENKAEKDPAWVKKQEENKKYADALHERQRAAQEERQRILKRIRDDRAERINQAQLRKEELALGKERAAEEARALRDSSSKMREPSKMASLQVRLFDGSTIRSRFSSTATLRGEVRKWVDAEREDGKEPYTFKVMLTPLPNRNIDDTEEEKSLKELELAPSATLLLIPVTKKVATAYAGAASSGGNIFMRIWSAIVGFLSWLVGLVTGAFSGVGGRRGAAEESAPEDGSQAGRNPDGSRIRGFRNPNDRRGDHQLYNGNSVSLIPSSPNGRPC